jgi:hypothetical protein
VIPPKGKIFEKDQRESRKDDKRDHLLDHLQLDKGERASLLLETDPVGRHLETIFKKSNPPADEDNGEQGRMPGTVLPEKTQMPVPGHRHKSVGKDQKPDSVKDRFHALCFAAK